MLIGQLIKKIKKKKIPLKLAINNFLGDYMTLSEIKLIKNNYNKIILKLLHL